MIINESLLINFDCYSHAIKLNDSKIVFFKDYRFPLLRLDQELRLNNKSIKIDPSLLIELLDNELNRADFYWLVHRGLVSITQIARCDAETLTTDISVWQLDTTASSLKQLIALNQIQLSTLLKQAIEEVEIELGINNFTLSERNQYLQRYGYCPKANKQILTLPAESLSQNLRNIGRYKHATVRQGQTANQITCQCLIRSVFQKQVRNIRYEQQLLFRRVMPSVGSLCSIEAILVHSTGFWLYDSQHDKFKLLAEINKISAEQIHGDLWLNCGNYNTKPSSAIILYAVQGLIRYKYGEISSYLQSVETGILLGELWSLMPTYQLNGCILGNPMLGVLTKNVKHYYGDVIPMSGLMLFDGDLISD